MTTTTTGDRQTGRTSAALRTFDELASRRRGAIYVVGSPAERAYTLSLARSLGLRHVRSAQVVTVHAVAVSGRLRGLYRSDVLLDHAALDGAARRDRDRLLAELDLLAQLTLKDAL